MIVSIEVTSHNIKSIAKKLKSVLLEHKLELKHSQSLEIVAKVFGFKDWNSFSAKLNGTFQSNVSHKQRENSSSDAVLSGKWLEKEDQLEERRHYFKAAIADMTFVFIPAGQVRMSDMYTAEITKDFYICDHPVTCREFNAYLMDMRKELRDSTLNDYPVVDISWINAQDYISWLNSFAEEEIYRLPTEAEWEYACRAGTTTTYSFGDSVKDLPKHCWYFGNSEGKLQPVKQLLPNPWGLYDMHGNVSEWVYDYYGSYPSGCIKDPIGEKPGTDRVLRGGSYLYGRFKSDSEAMENLCGLGSADRNGCPPLSCRNFVGFRLVKQGLLLSP